MRKSVNRVRQVHARSIPAVSGILARLVDAFDIRHALSLRTQTGVGLQTDEGIREMYAALVPNTRYPFVRLVKASGVVARESERVVADAMARLEQERLARARLLLHRRQNVRRDRARPLFQVPYPAAQWL